MASMYFIAFVLPTDINNEVLKWKLFMNKHFNCFVALRSPAHITLVPPFWMNDDLENKLENSISQFSQNQSSFQINLKNFAAFKPKVIYVDVLPTPSLQTLHDQLQDHVIADRLFPIKKDDRPFQPHVTVATRDLNKKAFYDAWETFKEERYEASCRFKEISLLKHDQKKWDVIFTSHFPN